MQLVQLLYDADVHADQLSTAHNGPGAEGIETGVAALCWNQTHVALLTLISHNH